MIGGEEFIGRSERERERETEGQRDRERGEEKEREVLLTTRRVLQRTCATPLTA